MKLVGGFCVSTLSIHKDAPWATQLLMESVSGEASTIARLTAIWMVGVHSNCWIEKEELKR